MKMVVELLGEESNYFRACARIRDIAPGSLVRRLINAIATDQLVLPILDDEGERRGPRKGEHRYSETRASG